MSDLPCSCIRVHSKDWVTIEMFESLKNIFKKYNRMVPLDNVITSLMNWRGELGTSSIICFCSDFRIIKTHNMRDYVNIDWSFRPSKHFSKEETSTLYPYGCWSRYHNTSSYWQNTPHRSVPEKEDEDNTDHLYTVKHSNKGPPVHYLSHPLNRKISL